MPSNKILLTDGRTVSCLAFARQLGREGNEVHVGESFRHNITAYSKFTSESCRYPSAEEDRDGFETAILDLIRREAYDLVIPIRDAPTNVLAGIQDRLPAATSVLLDTPETIERLNDKERCAKLAEQVGVPIPATYYPSETALDEIREAAEFPVLVKPTNASGARGIQRVENPADLEATYRSVTRDEGPAIVQEFVDHSGGHFSIGTVFDRRSEPQAIHVYEELVQYPDSGGPAVQAVSVDVEPWVDELLEILRAVDWIGPAHMDVLFDPADETFKLLEVNPRIWMSVALTIASGVNIPRVIMDIANGADVSAPESYDTELSYRWVIPNEILWAIDGRDTPDRIQRLLHNGDGPTCYGILSTGDPSASVGALAQSFEFVLNKEKRRMIFDRGW